MRNRKKGAYELGEEGFRNVYRYVVRSLENYHGTAELARFTLDTPGAVQEEAADQFGEVLRDSLRRSDVYAKSGRNRYLVLLSETDGENGEQILSRVAEQWKKTGTDVRAAWEATVLRG